MAYKLAVFEILRVFLYKHILCVCSLPTLWCDTVIQTVGIEQTVWILAWN